MRTRRILSPRFTICINNSEYPASLELHKVYQVVPDKDAERDGDLRIIDESGEDYLYPAEYFVSLKLSSTIVRTLTRRAHSISKRRLTSRFRQSRLKSSGTQKT